MKSSISKRGGEGMRKREKELLRQQMELLAKESERMLPEMASDRLSDQMVKISRSLAFDGLIRLILLAALADLVVGFFVLLVNGFGI